MTLVLPFPGQVWLNRGASHRGDLAVVVDVGKRTVRYRPLRGRERSLTFSVPIEVWWRCWTPAPSLSRRRA